MNLQRLKQGFGYCLLLLFIAACQPNKEKAKLPILGDRDTKMVLKDGESVIDTIYHTIPPFKFMDQDSLWISRAEVKDKIYLADFFFTRCPTICPLLSKNMLAIAQEFEQEPQVLILSHTIDEKYDSPAVLHEYAERLGAPSNWRFLHGPQEAIYYIAGQAGYFSYAQVNNDVPGGFDHSGAFTLVDKQGRVRGVYDGTKEEDALQAIQDIRKLLTEE